MDNNEHKDLVEKYLRGECTEAEKAIVENWYHALANKKKPVSAIDDYQSLKAEIWESIEKSNRRNVRPVWAYVAGAAYVLVALTFGLRFYHTHSGQKSELVKHTRQHDFAPGGSKAVLVLANGEKIVLTNAKNGMLAKVGNMQVSKTSDGAVTFVVGKSNNAAHGAGENTLSTPKGGLYHVTLADGTRATLDAMSSIRFPSQFSGTTREVSTTGQVYFEVAHNRSKPFVVKTVNQTVEVLGTHFNVSAFESPKTTLLQGSVKVTVNGQYKLLKPGQQSAFNAASNKIKVAAIDTAEAVAWKNNFFYFNNADVRTVMDQVGRWYDVEVVYEGDLSDKRFSGKIYKNMNASKVLSVLSLSGMHFKIEGKKITVTPNL